MLGSAWLDDEFINTATRETFWTPQKMNNGEVNEQSYALTWRWREAGSYAHHGGVSKGSMAWLAVYPEQSLVIAMAMNTTLPEFTDFSSLQTELVTLFSKAKETNLQRLEEWITSESTSANPGKSLRSSTRIIARP